MNVAELIEELQQLEPSLLVVLSSDEEGNDYNELAAFSPVYHFDTEEKRVVHHDDLLEEAEGEAEWEDLEKGTEEYDTFVQECISSRIEGTTPCIILWP